MFFDFDLSARRYLHMPDATPFDSSTYDHYQPQNLLSSFLLSLSYVRQFSAGEGRLGILPIFSSSYSRCRRSAGAVLSCGLWEAVYQDPLATCKNLLLALKYTKFYSFIRQNPITSPIPDLQDTYYQGFFPSFRFTSSFIPTLLCM